MQKCKAVKFAVFLSLVLKERSCVLSVVRAGSGFRLDGQTWRACCISFFKTLFPVSKAVANNDNPRNGRQGAFQKPVKLIPFIIFVHHP